MENKIVSFDFDGSLDDNFNGKKNPYKNITRDQAKELIQSGYEVYIITRRYSPGSFNSNEFQKAWNWAEELGIPKNRVVFTDRKWKYSFIKSVGAFMHIDDDEIEICWMNIHIPEIIPILVGESEWEEKFAKAIEENSQQLKLLHFVYV